MPNQDPDSNGASFVLNMRFPGQQYDGASSLNHNGFRDYESSSARYSQSDLVGLLGGVSTYGYALSNSLAYFDPDGLQAQPKPAPVETPGRFTPPNLPPANDSVYGPRRWWLGGLAGELGKICRSPQVVVGVILMSIPGNVGQPGAGCSDDPRKERPECQADDGCPPCRLVDGTIVPAGTIGYRLDKVPPSRPHYPYTGDHYNLSRANQNPNNCRCFWQPIGAADAAGGLPPPPGSIPIQPFAM